MENLERQAIRLVVFRTIVGLTFFLSALGIQVTIGGEGLLRPFFYIIAFILGLNLIYSVIYGAFRGFRGSGAFIYLQLLGDIFTVTLLSYLTGGFTSIFTFLYHILILVAGFLLRKRGAFTIAALNSIAYGLLCVGLFYRWIPQERFTGVDWMPPTAQETLSALMAHLFGFFLIAALVSMMAGRIEATRTTLGIVQRDLKSLRHLNDQIVSSLDGGLVTTDITGRITFANEAAKQILEETGGLPQNLFHRLKALDVKGLMPDMEMATLAQEVVLDIPQDRHLLLVLQPLKEGGNRVGYLALLRDQTEVARLRRSLEIKDRMAMMGEMAANIAHEIRNPLGSISGSAQMLKRGSAVTGNESTLLNIIQSESQRLGKILDNFLRFASPLPPSPKPIRLDELVREVIELFRHDPEFPDEIELQAAMKEPMPLVSVDPDQVRQALWNLLQNSRKALTKGGTIRVGLSRENGKVILEVVDDGPGMDPSQIPEYVQPFRKGFLKGIGLGLPLVVQVMDQHHGNFEIQSRRGEGTRCRLVFPIVGKNEEIPKAVET